MGLTVVGNPAATVITSSPGCSRFVPSCFDVSALSATRFAEDPELTRETYRTQSKSLNRFSNSFANLPSVHHPSRTASMAFEISRESNTFPEGGICVFPGINGRRFMVWQYFR